MHSQLFCSLNDKDLQGNGRFRGIPAVSWKQYSGPEFFRCLPVKLLFFPVGRGRKSTDNSGPEYCFRFPSIPQLSCWNRWFFLSFPEDGITFLEEIPGVDDRVNENIPKDHLHIMKHSCITPCYIISSILKIFSMNPFFLLLFFPTSSHPKSPNAF